MPNVMSLFLVPIMAGLLVLAQATWGTAIKKQHILEGSASKILSNLVTSPRIWLGIIIYVCATAVYFVLLSKIKFFSVQLSMTALSIIFSTALAHYLFHEHISLINIAGGCMVLAGVGLVLAR